MIPENEKAIDDACRSISEPLIPPSSTPKSSATLEYFFSEPLIPSS
ncbi:hypothetical protein SLEP1_g13023 [Rubroshorea leprosula]|uniref:Uncharacterized protein n=1 Tax=Rubroshorea leprosula TaxID=152421 RepID=A0AAV5IKC4_9ROSI|nr:hypothetical protein SLEP1_g13023 [Rubroshorea leprosula]